MVMTFKGLQSMVLRNNDGLDSGDIKDIINVVISDMNLRVEGIRESEICMDIANEIAGEFAGLDGLPGSPVDLMYYLCSTSGGDFTAGDLWKSDDGQWSEITLSELTQDDVYWCSAVLTTSAWAKGEVRYYSGSAWVDTGYLWDDNHRLTLKSNIVKTKQILIDDEPWGNRDYDSIDNDNDWAEYYEESRGVFRFSDYYTDGTMRIICKTSISELTGSSTPATVINVPTAWQSTFVEGVMSQAKAGEFSDRYENGLKRIEDYEANRLPFAATQQ